MLIGGLEATGQHQHGRDAVRIRAVLQDGIVICWPCGHTNAFERSVVPEPLAYLYLGQKFVEDLGNGRELLLLQLHIHAFSGCNHQFLNIHLAGHIGFLDQREVDTPIRSGRDAGVLEEETLDV